MLILSFRGYSQTFVKRSFTANSLYGCVSIDDLFDCINAKISIQMNGYFGRRLSNLLKDERKERKIDAFLQ